MHTFVTLIVATIILFVIGFLVEKFTSYDYEWISFVSVGIGVCTLIALVISALSLINVNTRFEATQNEYQVIREMVESYDGQDYGNMTALTESVVKINSKIANHKAHYKSEWTGPWFSEDIANLEPITFRKIVKE